MVIQDKLRERAQPYLEPGERIQSVFMARTGPTPWLVTYCPTPWLAKYRVVIVTNQAVIVLKAGTLRAATPKELVRRLPRNTRFGPFEYGFFVEVFYDQRKVWGKIQIDGKRHWVHRRFRSDVDVADALLPGSSRPETSTQRRSRSRPRNEMEVHGPA